MFDIAYLTLCGRVAVSPETKTLEDGKKVTSFSMAVNVDKDKVNFYSVACFGYLSQYASEQLEKGLRCTVLGRVEQVMSKEGRPYSRMIADSIFPGTYKPSSKNEKYGDSSEDGDGEYV